MRSRIPFALAVLGVVAAAVPAQQDVAERRFDIGKRLRRFERAYAALPPTAAAARTSAAESMRDAVAKFFGLDLAGAAAAIDGGTLRMRGPAGAEPGPTARALAALGVFPSRQVVGPRDTLTLRIAPAYEGVEPVAVHVFVSTGRSGPVAEVEGTPPFDIALEPDALLGEGDERILVRAGVTADQMDVIADFGVSIVADAEARVARLAAVEAEPSGAGALELATIHHVARTVRSLVRGTCYETDLPAHRLVVDAEAAAAALAAGSLFHGPDRLGEHWLAIPIGRRAVPIRLFVPRTDEDRPGPRPLVLALHGAGGSENLFFDAYGDGLAIALARQRDAYVCAPRALPAGSATALVDALAARWPIDRTKVFCVGHSMGAMTAVAAADAAPKLFAKVAALGGGGRVRDAAALRTVPFFVGAGADDFGLAGAKSLARTLERGQVPVELHVYPDVEHLLVVQVALPEVFAFFDR